MQVVPVYMRIAMQAETRAEPGLRVDMELPLCAPHPFVSQKKGGCGNPETGIQARLRLDVLSTSNLRQRVPGSGHRRSASSERPRGAGQNFPGHPDAAHLQEGSNGGGHHERLCYRGAASRPPVPGDGRSATNGRRAYKPEPRSASFRPWSSASTRMPSASAASQYTAGYFSAPTSASPVRAMSAGRVPSAGPSRHRLPSATSERYGPPRSATSERR